MYMRLRVRTFASVMQRRRLCEAEELINKNLPYDHYCHCKTRTNEKKKPSGSRRVVVGIHRTFPGVQGERCTISSQSRYSYKASCTCTVATNHGYVGPCDRRPRSELLAIKICCIAITSCCGSRSMQRWSPNQNGSYALRCGLLNRCGDLSGLS